VNNKYGSLQDFINIVQTMQKSNIMLSPIIDLKDIINVEILTISVRKFPSSQNLLKEGGI